MNYIKNTEAEFNSSFESLRRLNKQLINCNYFSGIAQAGYDVKAMNLWRSKLFAVLREIDAKLTEPERKSLNKLFVKFMEISDYNNKSGKYKPLFKYTNTQEGRVRKLNVAGFEARLNILHNTELLLRRYADKHGLLITNKQRIEDNMDL